MEPQINEPLFELIRTSENWLIRRILKYAKERGYVKYTSTLEEAWRLSIAGLSEPLLDSLRKSEAPLELTPDEDFTEDPVASFGVKEAKLHRTRGVTIGMFLGLMKYYRQSYLDLIDQSDFSLESKQHYSLFVRRFFDRVELGFCMEWTKLSEDEKIEELQSKSRMMKNEKNK